MFLLFLPWISFCYYHCTGRKLGVKDLRLKLQKRSTQETSQSLNRSVSRGTRDLREKLSGTIYSEAGEVDPSKPKRNPAPDISKPVRKSVIAEAPVLETKKVASTISKKKSQQKARIFFYFTFFNNIINVNICLPMNVVLTSHYISFLVFKSLVQCTFCA